MAKGFAYQWNPTKASADKAAWSKTVIENFRQLESFVNGYIPTFESGSEDLILPADLTVTGDLTVAGATKNADGKLHIHVYDSVGSQAITGSTWTKVNLDSELGSHSLSNFTHNTADDSVTLTNAGVYLVVAQVVFQAAETGYLRIIGNGSNEIARGTISSGLGDQVVALFHSSLGNEITFEVFANSAADLSASPGSVVTYMGITKLYGVGV